MPTHNNQIKKEAASLAATIKIQLYEIVQNLREEGINKAKGGTRFLAPFLFLACVICVLGLIFLLFLNPSESTLALFAFPPILLGHLAWCVMITGCAAKYLLWTHGTNKSKSRQRYPAATRIYGDMPTLKKNIFGTILLLLILPSAAAAQSDLCETLIVESNRPTILVTVQGDQYPAVLTTSNLGSTISRALVEKLDLRERIDSTSRVVSSFGRSRMREYVTDVDLGMFGDTINADEMTIVESEEAQIGLSLRLFEELVIQLNFPQLKICFFPRDAVKLQESQNIPIDTDPRFGSPVVQVKLNNDITTWLRLSPDYIGGLLVDPFLARELELHLQVSESLDPDDTDTLSAIMSELEFGPYVLGDVPVEFPRPGTRDNLTTRRTPQTGTNIRSTQGYHGTLGFDVLRHFVITIDLKSERMHVIAD